MGQAKDLYWREECFILDKIRFYLYCRKETATSKATIYLKDLVNNFELEVNSIDEGYTSALNILMNKFV